MILHADTLMWLKYQDEEDKKVVAIKDKKLLDENYCNWNNLGLNIYFPNQHKIYTVSMHQCISMFIKPQQVNIVSWVQHKCLLKSTQKILSLDQVQIPNYLQKAAVLVGAPLDSLSEKELADRYRDPNQKVVGWIYPDE